MSAAPMILRTDDPRLAQLQHDGWVITARSWAAQLDVERVDRGQLHGWAARARSLGTVRELTTDDAPAALVLDQATEQDYPGGPATAHVPLTPATAAPDEGRQAFGVFGPDGALVAMTFADVDGEAAEIDFTVVLPEARGRGIGTALKAAMVLTLRDRGVTTIRTGGSTDNPASLRSSTALGFDVDEHWVTLTSPAQGA